MYRRSIDVSHNRDAAKKATHRRKLYDKQPTSSGVKSCGPKAADIFLMPAKLRKRDTALIDPVDSSSDEIDKEIDET